ncbi:MAG: beta-galactosidase [Bauldia sp.]|nr:beta-galactosidase [Bauldia sp.]
MLGVCYYPEHWPESWWADDARRMRDLGLRTVRIGEFAWSRIEPEPGRIEIDWLRRAVDTLGAAGLEVVLSTPTATPPKWLMDAHPEIAPVDEDGTVRGFGSRRHYTFSSSVFASEAARIAEVVARSLGRHPAVVGWQIDNEYGCHNTALSYGDTDLRAYREWLRRRYQSTEQMNEAWGNAFWSMELRHFNEAALPVRAVTETNPAARLDYWRFSSDQIVAFNRMQADIIRAHSPGRFVTHNFMGLFLDFDHFACGADLDLATWDSYPIGFTERFPFSEEERNAYAMTGHPDMAPFHHDLYRAVGRGRWWVMEQQAGPVNWAPWNPVPRPGQIRLFTWEAIAHGAERVMYFRWRQAPFGQEQMHSGLNLPDNSGLSPGGSEAAEVARELDAIGPLPAPTLAPVALVIDYEASWITRIQPQGATFNYGELAYRWYEAARRLGLDIDIVPPGHDLSAYRLVLAPSLPYVSEVALNAFKKTTAEIVFGPRSGSKTRHFSIPENLPPGPLAELIPFRVVEVASLRPGLTEEVKGRISGQVRRWREHIACEKEFAEAAFADGMPAMIRSGRFSYLAGWAEIDLISAVLVAAAERARVATTSLPASLRLRRRGNLKFAFNYGSEPVELTFPPDAAVLGSSTVPPSGVTIWRED